MTVSCLYKMWRGQTQHFLSGRLLRDVEKEKMFHVDHQISKRSFYSIHRGTGLALSLVHDSRIHSLLIPETGLL